MALRGTSILRFQTMLLIGERNDYSCLILRLLYPDVGRLCLCIGLGPPVDHAYRNPPLDGSAILDADRLFDIASADLRMADMVVKSLARLILVGGGGWVTVLKHERISL